MRSPEHMTAAARFPGLGAGPGRDPPRPRPRRDPFGTIGASDPSELIERNGALSIFFWNATFQDIIVNDVFSP